MAITELPTERSKVENYNPAMVVFFGKPKSGKSTLMASLDDNLILDCENGYRSLPVMKIQVRTSRDFFDVRNLLQKKMDAEGKVPYRFITIDNATRLEDYSLGLAAHKYRNTAMGQGWGMLKDSKGMPVIGKDGRPVPDPKADVRLLPNGAGWLYCRQAIKEMVDMFRPYCETLILVAHVKDKQIKRDGKEMSEMSVDLAGKAADIICGEADAIGFIYREGNKTYISFEGGDDTIKEARPLHLRGKKFCVAESDEKNELKIDMSQIFIENK